MIGCEEGRWELSWGESGWGRALVNLMSWNLPSRKHWRLEFSHAQDGGPVPEMQECQGAGVKTETRPWDQT